MTLPARSTPTPATPLPWTLYVGGNFVRIGDANYAAGVERERSLGRKAGGVAEMDLEREESLGRATQDASFAVLAVNHHAALVEALTETCASLELAIGMLTGKDIGRTVLRAMLAEAKKARALLLSSLTEAPHA